MKVLFSSLGFNYGILYSAILLVRPSRVVVATSEQAIGNLHLATEAAHFFHPEFEVETHMFDDPLGGFEEGRLLSRLMVSSAGQQNVVNFTGGTAAMQDCMHALEARLQHQHCPVSSVAIVDRRKMEEQQRSPLVLGELVNIAPLELSCRVDATAK